MGVDDALHRPLGHNEAGCVGHGDDISRTGRAIDDTQLAEEVAGLQFRKPLTVLDDLGLAVEDQVEADTACSLLDDLRSRSDRPLNRRLQHSLKTCLARPRENGRSLQERDNLLVIHGLAPLVAVQDRIP